MVNTLQTVLEKASRPGLLGLPGMVVEKNARRELESYFSVLGVSIRKLGLENKSYSHTEPKHIVHAALYNVLRIHRPALLHTLSRNLQTAYLVASKRPITLEAKSFEDKVGDTAKKAAEYAVDKAASLIKGIDQTTEDLIADAVASGFEDQLGVDGVARLIREAVDDMTAFRSRMIASTEMNDAMSQATMDKMGDLNIQYKIWILSADACPICEANAEQGAIPIDEDFESGDSQPPAHPNCRCAVNGARGPDEEDD